jgi:hypothetical protein
MHDIKPLPINEPACFRYKQNVRKGIKGAPERLYFVVWDAAFFAFFLQEVAVDLLRYSFGGYTEGDGDVFAARAERARECENERLRPANSAMCNDNENPAI